MAVRLDTDLRNDFLAALNTRFGSGTLTIRSGTQNASANSAATGTALATITLPATPFSISSGAATVSGTWQDTSADATGTAAHFRMEAGTYVLEGSVTATGGGGDLTLDSTSITAAQQVTVTGGSITMPSGE